MKNLKSFLKALEVNPLFAESFTDSESVFSNFQITVGKEIKILFAVCDWTSYESQAFVLFYNTQTEKYYEVNGLECSDYGLEGQWEPEEIELKVIENRINNGHFYDGNILKAAYLKHLE